MSHYLPSVDAWLWITIHSADRLPCNIGKITRFLGIIEIWGSRISKFALENQVNKRHNPSLSNEPSCDANGLLVAEIAHLRPSYHCLYYETRKLVRRKSDLDMKNELLERENWICLKVNPVLSNVPLSKDQ